MILGSGVDIIEIGRIQKAVEHWGDAFLKYVFTPKEIEYAGKFKFPYRHYAGRFAAKEAIFKAMGKAESWQNFSIVNDPNGKPICYYKDKTYKHRIIISISHSHDYAVASAIIED